MDGNPKAKHFLYNQIIRFYFFFRQANKNDLKDPMKGVCYMYDNRTDKHFQRKSMPSKSINIRKAHKIAIISRIKVDVLGVCHA